MCCPMPSIKQRPLQRALVLPTSSQTCLKIDFTALGHPILTTSHNAMSLEYSDLALFWKMYICNPLVLEEFRQLDWRLSWDFHFDALVVFHGTLLNPFRPRNVKACVDEALHSSLHLANGRKKRWTFSTWKSEVRYSVAVFFRRRQWKNQSAVLWWQTIEPRLKLKCREKLKLLCM